MWHLYFVLKVFLGYKHFVFRLQTLCSHVRNTLFARQKHFVPTLGILCSHVGNTLFPCWELFLTDNLPALFLTVHIRGLLNHNAL